MASMDEPRRKLWFRWFAGEEERRTQGKFKSIRRIAADRHNEADACFRLESEFWGESLENLNDIFGGGFNKSKGFSLRHLGGGQNVCPGIQATPASRFVT